MHDSLFLMLLFVFLTGWGFYMHSLDSAAPEEALTESLPASGHA